MAEDAEVPMEENAGESTATELLTGNNENPDPEKDEFTKLTETDMKMLEDETMPTYTSITSITISSKQDDSKIENDDNEIEACAPENLSSENCDELVVGTQQQKPIKEPNNIDNEDDECQVVELSSGEEEDEEEEEYIEEDKDDDTEDDEQDDDEYIDDERGNNYRSVMASEDEECEDDTMDYDIDSDDGHSRSESGDDVEADQFERSSDDYQMTIRSIKIKNLKKEDKERSKSLQNLSSKTRSNGIKRKMCNYNQQDSISSSSRYNNISKKHRHFIDSDREPNMIHAERKRLRKQMFSIQKENDPLLPSEEEHKSDHPINIPQEKSHKQYAEMYPLKNNTATDREAISLVIGEPIIRESVENGVELEEIDPYTGIPYVKPHFTEAWSFIRPVRKNPSDKEANGQIEKVVEAIDVTNASLSEIEEDQFEHRVNELERSLVISQNENEKNKTNFTIEYNIVVNKNLELTNEMIELKKALAKYQENEKKAIEKSNELKKADSTNLTDASVQTEDFLYPPHATTMSQSKPPTSTLSFSSLGSVVSTAEQWTDSNCSPAISLKPPNVESILNNTDDSFLHGSARKTTNRPLSQAFFTSSRILQTLANITQGRPDPANPNTGNSVGRIRQGDIQGQSNVPTCPLVSNSSASTSSRKRKAESPERQPPFKIPSLVPNAFRRIFNSPSNADGGKTKKNGDLLKSTNDATSENPSRMIVDGATLTPEKQNIKSDEDNKQQDAEEIALGDGIKCFVYHDDDDSGERSFLIQATESLQKANGKGIVRECGPYLLKNIEVRMSEANGTINIWGKEIKNDSTSGDIDENLDEEDEPSDLNNATDTLWSRMPDDKFKSPYVCSTEKKTKQKLSSTISSPTRSHVPRFSLDHHHHHHHPIANHFGSMPNLDRRSNSYICQKQRIDPQVNKSQCRLHDCEINDRECPCETEIESHIQNKHACQRLSNPHSPDVHYSSRNENPCCQMMDQHRASPIDSLFQGSNDRLINSEKSSPISEIRRHRLRGKKVRGILMDFLKGCGQCKDPHTTNENHFQPSSAPEIRVTPAFDTPSCSKITNPASNTANATCHHNCCNTYPKRIDVTDLERQIQVFRVDMEKMLSRSDAFLDMLNVLQNMDAR